MVSFQASLACPHDAQAIYNVVTDSLSSTLSERDWVGQVASLNRDFVGFHGDGGTGFLIQTPHATLQGRLALTAAHVLSDQAHDTGAHRFSSPNAFRMPGLGIVHPSGLDLGVILFPQQISGNPPDFSSSYNPYLSWNIVRPTFTIIGGENSTTIREGIAQWTATDAKDWFVLAASPHKTREGDSGGPTLHNNEIVSIHWQSPDIGTTFNEIRVDKSVDYFDWIQGSFVNIATRNGGSSPVPSWKNPSQGWSQGNFQQHHVLDVRTDVSGAWNYTSPASIPSPQPVSGLLVNPKATSGFGNVLSLRVIYGRDDLIPATPELAPLVGQVDAAGTLNAGTIKLTGGAFRTTKLDNTGHLNLSTDAPIPSYFHVSSGLFNEGSIVVGDMALLQVDVGRFESVGFIQVGSKGEVRMGEGVSLVVGARTPTSLALLDISGLVSGNVILKNGARLRGNGKIQGRVDLAPNSSIDLGSGADGIGSCQLLGDVSVSGDVVWNLGVNDVAASDGEARGWGSLAVGGKLALAVAPDDKITISLELSNPQGIDGLPDNFDPQLPFTLPFAFAEQGIDGFSTNSFDVQVTNPELLNGGRFVVEKQANSLALAFLPRGTSVHVPGDFNADGVVDGNDFLLWQTQFGPPQSPQPIANADGNGDGMVDSNDLAIWKNRFGARTNELTKSVPEPPSIAFLVSMSCAIAGRCHRMGRTYRPSKGVTILTALQSSRSFGAETYSSRLLALS